STRPTSGASRSSNKNPCSTEPCSLWIRCSAIRVAARTRTTGCARATPHSPPSMYRAQQAAAAHDRQWLNGTICLPFLHCSRCGKSEINLLRRSARPPESTIGDLRRPRQAVSRSRNEGRLNIPEDVRRWLVAAGGLFIAFALPALVLIGPLLVSPSAAADAR